MLSNPFYVKIITYIRTFFHGKSCPKDLAPLVTQERRMKTIAQYESGHPGRRRRNFFSCLKNGMGWIVP
jgi:hypothetical protein